MRILVVDDHSLFRDGLVSLLKAAGYEIAGEAGNGEDALRETARLNPDLVLMDMHMPGMGGLDALKRLHEEMPKTRVVMLTVSDKEEDLIAAIECGANGYLLKNLDARAFIAHLRRLESGDVAVSSEMTGRLLSHIARRAREEERNPRGAGIDLSAREVELLKLLAQGLSNKSIALRLSISENTVKYHVKHILQKMNLSNRAEAAAFAVQKGFVHPENDD